MAKLLNYQTGKLEEVSDDEATGAILRGTHSPLKGEVLNVVSPSGSYGTIPAEKAREYFQDGFRLEGGAERQDRRLERDYGEGGGFATDARAFAEGAARGVTFGLSDHLLQGAGVSAEALRERKNRNPYAATSGEVSAILASTLLTGGATGAAAGAARGGKIAAALTKGGRIAGLAPAKLAGMGRGIEKTAAASRVLQAMAAKGVAGRAAAKAASMGLGSAVEGAFYGAGKLVSEDALGETELNAERLAAYMGTGFLLGGGSAAALGSTAQIAKSGIMDSALSKSLGKWAGKPLKSMQDIQGWLKSFSKSSALKAGLGQQKKAFDQLKRFKNKDLAEDYMLGVLKREKSLTPEDFIEHVKADRAKIGEEIGERVKTLDSLKGKVDDSEFVSYFKVASRIDDEIIKPIKKLGVRPSNKSALREAEAYLDSYLGSSADDDVMTFATAQAERASIKNADSFADPGSLRGVRADIQKIINEEAEKKADKMFEAYSGDFDKKTFVGYKELKKRYSVVKGLDEFVDNRINANSSNRKFGLTDYGSVGIGAALGDTVLSGGAAGAALGAANKFIIRERGDALAALAADKLSNLGMIESLSNAVSMTIDTSSRAAVKALKLPRAITPMASKLADKPKPRKRNIRPYHVLEKTHYASKRTQVKDRVDAYRKRLDELSEIVSDPISMADRIEKKTGGISSVAPNIGQSLANATVRSAQYLYDKAPKPSEDFNQFSRAKDLWEPNYSALAKWERIVKAVENPVSLFDDMAEGRLSPDSVDAVRDVYPQLYAQMMQTFIERVSELKEPLPKEARVQIDIFQGSMSTPPPTVGIQESAAETAADIPEQEPVKVRVGALDSIVTSTDNQTEMQRLASR